MPDVYVTCDVCKGKRYKPHGLVVLDERESEDRYGLTPICNLKDGRP